MEKKLMGRMPTLHDIIRARPHVYRFLKPTPLYTYSGLCNLIGAEVWVKHENHLPVGAFKVRGGLNLAANLPPEEKQGGLFTASTGNHGQSIAFAARKFGIATTIAVPEGANPGKVAAMEGLGATVIEHGQDFDTAREWVKDLAHDRGGIFVGPTDAPLIHGVGTYALEIMEALPDADVIIVPVGGGSGACATAIVAKTIRPQVRIIGVQSAQAPAMQKSWQSKTMAEAEMNTIAEGLATRVPFANTQQIMRRYLDDFILVDDPFIEQAVFHLLQHTHNLAEEAGAASLAAAIRLRDDLAGKKIVLVLSGGNIAPERLHKIIKAYS